MNLNTNKVEQSMMRCLVLLVLVCSFIGCSSTKKLKDNSCKESRVVMNDLKPKHVQKNTNGFKVIGYLRPRGYKYVKDMDLSWTTHINLSFGNINEEGELVVDQDITSVVSSLQAQNIKVFIALGGGGVKGEVGNYWRKYVDVKHRDQLISNLIGFVNRYNLDGIDVDFENDFLKSLGDNYNVFVIELKKALGSRGLSAAFPGRWLHKNVSDEAIDTFDFINIMAYDNRGPWNPNRPGQHSPLSLLTTVNDFWVKDKGVSKDKIIFGLPFYGYDFSGDKVRSAVWSNIVTNNPESGYVDQVGELWYNGIPTIAKKTHASLDMFGGVMVWSYGVDIFSDMSLIKTINQVVDAGVIEGSVLKTYYADSDGDGFGDIYHPFQAYRAPEGYVDNRKDINDLDPSVHP
ncbi:hypothetical protein K5X82_04535 [Halosquirtibacter xylanolyticus]|uniref:glycosyl hydrolase family 18 protein n=1 Tax=Halosquirtibacter xylanolyticus TaxID=3374599 RepID=UPI003749E495|nr:hypothetical protein K5X82_04535 [Prolixibacteraceae bacterium]